MAYPEIPGGTHIWTAAFDKFWSSGIELTEIGTLGSYGIHEAIDADRFPPEKYDFARAAITFNSMIFLRVIDNFQTYIVDLLLELFELRPEIVPKGGISYRELFNNSDIEELRKIAIQRVVLGYSYQNVVDLSADISKNLSFEIFQGQLRTLRIRRLLEIRNVLIHNRGVKNQPFIEKCGSKADKSGVLVDVPNALRVLRYLDRVAHDIDLAACKKFLPAQVTADA